MEWVKVAITATVGCLLAYVTWLLVKATNELRGASESLNEITKDIGEKQQYQYDREYLLWIKNNAPVIDFCHYSFHIKKDGSWCDGAMGILNTGHLRASLNEVRVEGQSFGFAGEIFTKECRFLSDTAHVKRTNGWHLNPPLDPTKPIHLEFFYRDHFGNEYLTSAEAGLGKKHSDDLFKFLIHQSTHKFEIIKRIDPYDILRRNKSKNETNS